MYTWGELCFPMLFMNHLFCCNLPTALWAASVQVCIWVPFISPVLALACLPAICPCGPQQSKTQTDSLTQPGGQELQFCVFTFLDFPVLSMNQPLLRLEGLCWRLIVKHNTARIKYWYSSQFYLSSTFCSPSFVQGVEGHRKDSQRGRALSNHSQAHVSVNNSCCPECHLTCSQRAKMQASRVSLQRRNKTALIVTFFFYHVW